MIESKVNIYCWAPKTNFIWNPTTVDQKYNYSTILALFICTQKFET